MLAEAYLNTNPVLADKEPEVTHPDDRIVAADGDDILQLPKHLTSLCLLSGVRNVEKLEALKKLRWFETTECTSNVLSKLSKLKALQFVHLSRSRNCIPEVTARIRYWSFFACSALENLDFISQADSVQGVSISDCSKFRSLESVARCLNLREFVVRGRMCPLDSLEPLEKLKELEYVVIAPTFRSKSILPLAQLKNLKYLWISSRVKKDQYEKVLERCPRLKRIELGSATFDLENGLVKSVFDD